MKILLNETNEAKRIIELGKANIGDMYLMVKYYSKEYKTIDELYNKVNEFMLDNCGDYNEVIYYDKLMSMVKNVIRKGIKTRDIDSVTITKSELDYINNNCTNSKQKKVLLTFLVYAKIVGRDIDNKYYIEIFRDSCSGSYNKDKRHDMIRELVNIGALRLRVGSVVVRFISNDEDVAMTVTDFNKIGKLI